MKEILIRWILEADDAAVARIFGAVKVILHK